MSRTGIRRPALGGVVLAAGRSSRFGSCKALAVLDGEPLVVRAARQLARHCDQGVWVVAGAEYRQIRTVLEPQPATVIHNTRWSAGLSASLRCGVEALPPGTGAALVLLCDQAAISPADLAALVGAWAARPGRPAAAAYAGRFGPPVILPRVLWPGLVTLQGDRGARDLLVRHPTTLVPMPRAAEDVDTPGDLLALQPSGRRRGP